MSLKFNTLKLTFANVMQVTRKREVDKSGKNLVGASMYVSIITKENKKPESRFK